MITITKTITQPEDSILQFAMNLGYQPKVKNEDYVAPTGAEELMDPDWVQPEDFDPVTEDFPKVPNPDYVPPVGEPFNDNPVTASDFVSQEFDKMATHWFSQFAERDARKQMEAGVIATVKATEEAVAQTIATVIK